MDIFFPFLVQKGAQNAIYTCLFERAKIYTFVTYIITYIHTHFCILDTFLEQRRNENMQNNVKFVSKVKT